MKKRIYNNGLFEQNNDKYSIRGLDKEAANKKVEYMSNH